MSPQLNFPHSSSTATAPFVKLHGLGNDYVYFDDRDPALGDVDWDRVADWAPRVADRHRGVGGDGVIVLRRDPEHACRMEMYNADGSRAEMCGNGLRCVARLAFERGYASEPTFTIATDAGPKEVVVLGENDAAVRDVQIEMGPGRLAESDLELAIGDETILGRAADVGNPHFVVPIDVRARDYPVHEIGSQIECDPAFPNRVNVEFVHVVDRKNVDFRVWERGSGETQACGTGACAAALVLHARGDVDSTVTIHLLGGPLEITVGEEGAITMRGATEEAFRGSIPLSWLS